MALLLWLAILTGACACGRQIRAWLRATGEARALEVAYDTALGLGVLAYLVLGLGLVGLLYPWALALAALSLYAVGWRQIPELVRWLREARWPAGRLDSLLWATLVVCAVAALVRNLVPPSSDEWDTLVYHLTAPKQFLQAHRIYFIEHDHHTNFPFNMEMLYLLGLGLHSDRLAKLFHLATYVLCVLALCGAGHSLREPGKGTDTSNAMGAAGAVAFATIPVVAWEAGTAYIDLGLALYGLLAVLAWSEWRQGRGRGWLVAAGLLAGLAFGVKMTGLLVVLFVCGATLLTEAWRRQARQAVASTLLLGAIAVGLASPWYIKTYVYTGNPVFRSSTVCSVGEAGARSTRGPTRRSSRATEPTPSRRPWPRAPTAGWRSASPPSTTRRMVRPRPRRCGRCSAGATGPTRLLPSPYRCWS